MTKKITKSFVVRRTDKCCHPLQKQAVYEILPLFETVKFKDDLKTILMISK